MTNRGQKTAAGLAVIAASLLLQAVPAKAQSAQQIIDGVIRNILENVRDQIQRRRVVVTPGMMRFSGEESEFNNRNPFGSQDSKDPFAALAYAKAPAMVAAPLPQWIYGINANASYDRTHTIFNDTDAYTVAGAFDVTKIGVFTASDSLTFVGTGAGQWARLRGVPPWLDTDTTTGAGTIAYGNGGFSADFTVNASWTRNTLAGLGIIAPPDSSSLSYTGNVQYKYDLLYSFWIEPTVGVTYTDIYTANFGTKTGDSTEVHAGGRVGTDIKWMSFTIQPTLSGAVFKTVDQSPAVLVTDNLGARGAAKVNVLWTNNFSTWLEAHASGIAGNQNQQFLGTQTVGASGGLRYSW